MPHPLHAARSTAGRKFVVWMGCRLPNRCCAIITPQQQPQRRVHLQLLRLLLRGDERDAAADVLAELHEPAAPKVMQMSIGASQASPRCYLLCWR
ncbi:MAG TPA: hypothetical protein PKZ08_12785 [Vicinamibacterales bacterium]|nr:hypothetical protein [Vicinamibacterales bacterium]